MARDQERAARAQQQVLVGGLPQVPGIGVAMRLTPGLGTHLRGLADEVLVNDYPGATLTRYEREFLATAVSAANDCFYCMDSHGAFVDALLERHGATELAPLIERHRTLWLVRNRLGGLRESAGQLERVLGELRSA